MATVHYVHEDRAWVDIGDHVFPTRKYGLIAKALREGLGVGPERIHGWDRVEDEDLERVHTSLSRRPVARTGHLGHAEQ